jgi:hypothetical protein
MIWVIELVVLLVFVGFGGFEGFIAWAVITALVMFARHSPNQTKLKAAELMIQVEKGNPRGERVLGTGQPLAPDAGAPTHLWIDSLGPR